MAARHDHFIDGKLAAKVALSSAIEVDAAVIAQIHALLYASEAQEILKNTKNIEARIERVDQIALRH